MTFGRNKKNFQIFTPKEFIAAVTQHIPEKNFQLVRYFGWYSNRKRGERSKAKELEDMAEAGVDIDENIEVLDVSDYKPKNIPSPTWRECIKKIWESDPLECPKCHGEMKIISFITDMVVIKMILCHLNFQEQERPPPVRDYSVVNNELTYEPFDDGWQEYQEPYTTLN
jgi:hypothetical protein